MILGKAIDHEVEGPHALIGSDLAKKYGESAKVVHAIAAHHEDVAASNRLCHADPGGRRPVRCKAGRPQGTLENYIKRLEDLENIANSFEGVANTYAIQAGREIRVIVESDKISDEKAVLMSQ